MEFKHIPAQAKGSEHKWFMATLVSKLPHECWVIPADEEPCQPACTRTHRKVNACNNAFNILNEHIDNGKVNDFLTSNTNCAVGGTFWTRASGSGNTQQVHLSLINILFRSLWICCKQNAPTHSASQILTTSGLLNLPCIGHLSLLTIYVQPIN